MFDQRSKLAQQLVRAQAMLWSAEERETKLRLRRMILDIEQRLAALDRTDAPPAPSPAAGKLGTLRR